jgi:DNA-binding transcriptional regulator YdaS (Cro superfamily)
MIYDMGIHIRRGSMNATFKDLVAFFGTQEATAEKLKVDQSTVSGWVRGKHGMSPVVAKRADDLTQGKFKKEVLCPSFPWAEMAA